MTTTEFYTLEKILSRQDINGKSPEIYIIEGNKTAGKTTAVSRYFIKRYLEYGEKFGLIYRYNYELDGVGDKFFKDVQALFFPEVEYHSEIRAKGKFAELYIDDTCCGYAFALNSADKIKTMSHLFNDVQRMVFDEFQAEFDGYCTREIDKLITLHTAIARGRGQHTRYVPIFMLSNGASIINPYYVQFGISNRLKSDTKFLRGNGWVMERCYNTQAAAELANTGFMQAFSDSRAAQYATQQIYLNDNYAFISRPNGKNRYLCTLRYNGNDYGVREYTDDGVVFVDDVADISHPMRFAITTTDHTPNYVTFRTMAPFVTYLRQLFNTGAIRFKNSLCKECFLYAIAYR